MSPRRKLCSGISRVSTIVSSSRITFYSSIVLLGVGYAVTKCGRSSPVSIIHTVRSRALAPFGETTSPSTMYFMPRRVLTSSLTAFVTAISIRSSLSCATFFSVYPIFLKYLAFQIPQTTFVKMRLNPVLFSGFVYVRRQEVLLSMNQCQYFYCIRRYPIDEAIRVE